jgi:hypothetical protein
MRQQIANKPLEYDDNIAACEKALPETKDTTYESRMTRMLEDLKAQRLDAIGRTLYNQALQIYKESQDYAASVTALRELKAKAAGSVWERKIDPMLKKHEALLERSRQK